MDSSTETTDPSGPRGGADRRPCIGALLICLAALLHGLTYLVLLPPWMGEDEPWHVEYAHHIGQGHLPWGGLPMRGPIGDKPDDRSLMSLSQLQVRRRIGEISAEEIDAVQRSILASLAEHHFWARVAFAGWGPGSENFDQVERGFTATHQPYPYYLLTGTLLGWLGIEDVTKEMYALRVFSLLCFIALVWLTWLLAREVSDDKWLPPAAALFVAWLPMHARQAAVVNNDVLVKVLAGGVILFSARVLRDKGGWGLMLALGVCAGLALFVKTTAAATLAALAFAVAWRLRARLGGLRGASIAGGLMALIAAGVGLLWYFDGSPVLPKTMSNMLGRLDAASSIELWNKLGRTFVGSFNWETRELPGFVYVAALCGMALTLGAALVVTLRGESSTRKRLLVLCWVLVLVQIVLIALRGEGRGRYFFPVLPALGVLVATGTVASLAPRYRARAVGGLALAMVAWDSVFLWRGLVFAQYGWWGS